MECCYGLIFLIMLTCDWQSSDSMQLEGLNIFLQLLRDSISNRASCVSAGMLNFLLDWFSQEDNNNVILRIAQLIQVIGCHSISGKDIRKIFMLLRSEKVGKHQQYCSLLMNCILAMLNEKGPTSFFDLVGSDSVSFLCPHIFIIFGAYLLVTNSLYAMCCILVLKEGNQREKRYEVLKPFNLFFFE